MEEVKTNKNFVKVLKGSIISLLITICLLFIASLIFTYTRLNENMIPLTVIIISASSIFFGSVISSKSIKKSGILNGMLVGAIYIITLYLFSSIFITGFSFNLKSIIMIVTSVLFGIIGGVVGVNL